MINTKGSDMDTVASIGMPISKSNSVRCVFDDVPHYLNSRRVDIRLRADTVKAFAANLKCRRLLDIGCGDGTVSLPLLGLNRHLTLLDLSTSMTTIARNNIPEGLSGNVDVKNENFMDAVFELGSFDLIVCVGVLAHVDSPGQFISKITSLLRPGGSLIIEFTDSRHFMGRLAKFMGQLKELLAPPKYNTNQLAWSDVAQIFKDHDLRLVSTFRYATIPMPGIEKVVAHEIIYKIVSWIFGQCTHNKAAWLGNEYICLVTRS
jgi:2-polyprenyl-3-methyl-5-hydroxy-6-metoxy-1,4-benzoquinol methylase